MIFWICLFTYLIIGGLVLLLQGSWKYLVAILVLPIMPFVAYHRLRREKPKNAKIILSCGIVIDICLGLICVMGIAF
jgi:hypothetical protein